MIRSKSSPPVHNLIFTTNKVSKSAKNQKGNKKKDRRENLLSDKINICIIFEVFVKLDYVRVIL